MIDWQERIELAAQCGLGEREFWDMTPRYFAARVKAWAENRQGMEEARFVAFHVIKTVDHKNRYRRLQQIARFPWERAMRRVELEPWDSPAMLKFDEEADKALAILNPKAFEEYMAGKAAREKAAELSENAADFRIETELDF